MCQLIFLAVTNERRNKRQISITVLYTKRSERVLTRRLSEAGLTTSLQSIICPRNR